MYSFPWSVTLAVFTIASAASIAPINPLVSIMPRASIGNSSRTNSIAPEPYTVSHPRHCLLHAAGVDVLHHRVRKGLDKRASVVRQVVDGHVVLHNIRTHTDVLHIGSGGVIGRRH